MMRESEDEDEEEDEDDSGGMGQSVWEARACWANWLKRVSSPSWEDQTARSSAQVTLDGLTNRNC